MLGALGSGSLGQRVAQLVHRATLMSTAMQIGSKTLLRPQDSQPTTVSRCIHIKGETWRKYWHWLTTVDSLLLNSLAEMHCKRQNPRRYAPRDDSSCLKQAIPQRLCFHIVDSRAYNAAYPTAP